MSKGNESKLLIRLLDELEGRLSPMRQEKVRQRHLRALNWEPIKKLPLVLSYPIPREFGLKKQPNVDIASGTQASLSAVNYVYPYEETFDNPEKMLIDQLLLGFGSIYYNYKILDDLPYTIRANFGTVIVASLFGAKIKFSEGLPPWATDHGDLQQYLEIDHLDLDRGICKKVIDRYRFYKEVLSEYPSVKQSVSLVMPDLQGPIDIAEQLVGSHVYTWMVKKPKLVCDLLTKISEAIISCANAIRPYTDEHLPLGYTHQHGVVIKGNILIREDSAINVSPSMYEQQIIPHNKRIIAALGGGGLHFCGNGQQLIPAMLHHPEVRCIDFGQPQLMELEEIYEQANKRQVPILRARFPKEELLSTNLQKRFPTGMIIVHEAKSFEEAKEISQEYYG
jgi:hypothetical protein